MKISSVIPPYDSRRWSIKISMYENTQRMQADTEVGDFLHNNQSVTNINAEFVDVLNEIQVQMNKEGETQPLSHEDCTKYLRELSRIGRRAYNMLPDEIKAHVTNMEQGEGRQRIALDFTVSPAQALMWELVYQGPRGTRQAEGFWGFRYPIGHLYWKTPPSPVIRFREGIFASMNTGLDYAHNEISHLECLLKQIGTDWNRQACVKRLEKMIFVQPLNDEALLDYFHGDEFVYGVVHFACHCTNPENRQQGAPELALTAHHGQITVAKTTLEEYKKSSESGFRQRPLVFLNACESSTPSRMSTFDFPRSFLEFGAGGVIATVCTIPDNFATAFAKVFYTKLLQRPSANVGEVLLETRLHFLHEFNNPLGLAYGLYAVSMQELLWDEY